MLDSNHSCIPVGRQIGAEFRSRWKHNKSIRHSSDKFLNELNLASENICVYNKSAWLEQLIDLQAHTDLGRTQNFLALPCEGIAGLTTDNDLWNVK